MVLSDYYFIKTALEALSRGTYDRTTKQEAGITVRVYCGRPGLRSDKAGRLEKNQNGVLLLTRTSILDDGAICKMLEMWRSVPLMC